MAEYLQKNGQPANQSDLQNLCATFQEAVVEQLVRKVRLALEKYDVTGVVVSGGVACNQTLRKHMAHLCEEKKKSLFIPPPSLCTDNAAMVASSAYFNPLSQGLHAPVFASWHTQTSAS